MEILRCHESLASQQPFDLSLHLTTSTLGCRCISKTFPQAILVYIVLDISVASSLVSQFDIFETSPGARAFQALFFYIRGWSSSPAYRRFPCHIPNDHVVNLAHFESMGIYHQSPTVMKVRVNPEQMIINGTCGGLTTSCNQQKNMLLDISQMEARRLYVWADFGVLLSIRLQSKISKTWEFPGIFSIYLYIIKCPGFHMWEYVKSPKTQKVQTFCQLLDDFWSRERFRC